MNHTRTPVGADPEIMPPGEQEVASAEVAEPEAPQTERLVYSDTPSAAQVGAHFAAEIADDAEAALHAAARLGPKRVLALLLAPVSSA